MTRRAHDETEHARATKRDPYAAYAGTIFDMPAEPSPPPHDWALTAIRRDIRATAEAMAVFSSEDVRERMSPALRACVDIAGCLMGQAFKSAAHENEIRFRDDLPSVVSQRDGRKGGRIGQWSRAEP